ncbi:E-selectin-like isoform X2 [Lampris incognitus]|uniref:E-selectin-like isoform X2 n=1 Tax=Lampris incognitus TaxID=2546036 RepID=UPI0024B5FB97|nr:E-selectin-like isoform X2 [Lampris incognitus]
MAFFGSAKTHGSKSFTSRTTFFLYTVMFLGTCVEGWSYYYSNNTMNWQDARTWCQKYYTDMVAIQNQEEIAYINDILPKMERYYWIGIRKVNNTWTWVGTNKPLTAAATNWAKNEPNNGKTGKKVNRNEDCVEMYVKRETETGKWNDERCTKMKTALCYTAACTNDACEHGECVETINNHHCECFEGFYGDRCEHAVQCKRDEVTIPPKANVNCSHKHGDYSYDSTCQYSCEEGYQPSTPRPIVCTASGNWSEQPPSCQLVQCRKLSAPDRGSMECSAPLGPSSYQSNCVFSCEEGYEMVESLSNTLQCGATGRWNDSRPFCVAVQCPDLQQPENGVVSCGEDPDMRFSYGNSCSFSCAPGYRLLGSSMVTCTSTAAWSERMPRCEAITCQKPEGAHLLTECSDPYNTLQPGSMCHFSCQTGFTLQGRPIVQCSEEGEWDVAIPTCTALQCPPPLAPMSGQIRCEEPSRSLVASAGAPHPLGSVCTFSCDEGHELRGVYDMECTQSGQWSSPLPTCTVKCPSLEAPANGGINCSDAGLVYNSQCSFTCDQHHSLHGHEVVTCDRHGNWTGETPECQESEKVLLTPTVVGAMTGGAISLSALSLAAWLIKRLKLKGNKFELNSNSEMDSSTQVYRNSIDSLI